MYNVSEDFRKVLYSGEADYDCRLFIENELVPEEQIQSITISSPIIDTSTETGKVFHIGTFISKMITIKFKNLLGLKLANNPMVYLEIGLKVNDEYEYVPIGNFIIDDLAENYFTTCEITALDYAVKFKSNVNIETFFNQTDSEGNKYIILEDLLIALCNNYGIELGFYPDVNLSKRVYVYDNSLSGKAYISYIAEMMGGNAKIDRNNRLNIIPLKQETVATSIDLSNAKEFEITSKYELTRICFDNLINKFEIGGRVISVDELPTINIDENAIYYNTEEEIYYRYGTNEETGRKEWQIYDMKNTLYIRSDNLFVTSESDITNIYNELNGFTVYSLKCKNRGDISLDAWDIVRYEIDETYYDTFYDNTLTFNGVAMATVDVKIPIQAVEETTNIVTTPQKASINRLKSEVDQANAEWRVTASKVSENEGKINEIDTTINGIKETITDYNDFKNRVTTLESSIDGLKTTITDNGGNNIFKYATEFWDNGSEGGIANFRTYTDSEILQNSVSNLGYMMWSGIARQVCKVGDGKYTISFKYKKLKSSAITYVLINKERHDLNSMSIKEEIYTIDIGTETLEIEFHSGETEAIKFWDLMGNVGSEKMIWTQNPNETRTDTVTIGKGIQVNSSVKNTYTRIDADGTRIFNSSTNSVTSEFTDKGLNTDELKSNTIQVAGVQIVEVDGQTWISSLI